MPLPATVVTAYGAIRLIARIRLLTPSETHRVLPSVVIDSRPPKRAIVPTALSA